MAEWSGGYRIMSSQDIESKFSVEDGFGYLDFSMEEPVEDDSEERLDQIRGILDRIPPREADFVDLYYFRQKRQTDIAAIFGVSQPTVCYRLQRAAERIKFLLKLPNIDLELYRPKITTILRDPIDIEILYRMNRTTCQSEVAKMMGVTQGFVRHRFIRSVSRLREAGVTDVANMFDLINLNLNIMREVQKPLLDGDVTRVLA